VKAVLTRIHTEDENHTLRTSQVVGYYKDGPALGIRFMLVSEALEINDGIRLVETSPVTSINGDEFTTESGTKYKLQQLSE
jgi:hypothetical protein